MPSVARFYPDLACAIDESVLRCDCSSSRSTFYFGFKTYFPFFPLGCVGSALYMLHIDHRNYLGRTDDRFRGLSRRLLSRLSYATQKRPNRFVLGAHIVLCSRGRFAFWSQTIVTESPRRAQSPFARGLFWMPDTQHPLGDRFLFIFMAGSGRRLASEKDIGVPSLVRMFGLRVDEPNFFSFQDN